MATQDEIMQNIYDLVSKGAGGGALTPEEQAALRKRYYAWIVTKKTGVATSPQDIWEAADGEKIQKQFEKIGREMVHQKKKNHLLAAAEMVERLSDCPHCPDPPTG